MADSPSKVKSENNAAGTKDDKLPNPGNGGFASEEGMKHLNVEEEAAKLLGRGN